MVKEKQTDRLEYASQGRLIWMAFRRHKLAVVGLIVLCVFYITAILAEFVAPYAIDQRFSNYSLSPPSRVHFRSKDGKLTGPFVYATAQTANQVTFKYDYVEDESKAFPIVLFIKTKPYKILTLIPASRKLFGVDGAPLYLLGSDRLGRDIFSRIIYASRISLSIGLAGVFISFILGCLIGALSGFFGGVVDEIVQRSIDLLNSIPHIPLWMALSAAVPLKWTVIQTYFAITLILALVGWTGLARVVRGKLMALREYDFAVAAKACGASELRIIFRHLLPAFSSYLVVNISLAIPGMILGETALSFLGLGIQAPAVSWGALLQDAQQLSIIAAYPWHLWPCAFVILTVLMFSFVGDGLRDAADPYSR